MCGIAGIIASDAVNYKPELQKMTDAIAHRGPDSAHHEYYANAALGHRRLSIVDLSPTGLQPMFSQTRNECIVLNGEIYGYLDIKKKYQNYPFRGSSDTELILAMYQRKGEQLVHDLPGMFAFAIWDEQKQQLFCARDRFGEKPFYYAIGRNGQFIFASEIKAIIASGLVDVTINQEALSHYLQYGYVSTYHSIYQQIQPLPPAHQLMYHNGKVEIKRYYSIPNNDIRISLSEAKEQFTSLLRSAVQKQVIADVSVGSFLSGGLDSSSIVAMASEYLDQQMTISFGYDAENSELKFAKEIADKYHTKHIEIIEQKKNIGESLLQVSPFFDEPFADMSYLPYFEICKAAKQHLTVVLSGDVGDELFGGYHFYRFENELKQHFSYHNIIAKWALGVYGRFKETSFVTQQNIKYNSIYEFHQNHVRNYLTQDERQRLGITKNYMQDYSFMVNPHHLNDIMRVDLEKYVPGNMMVKSDRIAMANSLEVRTPFLDKDFAEFCIQLPDQFKIDSERDKIILRESLQAYWTESIRNRGKQGFGNSVSNWFKENSLMQLSNDLLGNKNSKIYELIDYQQAQSMLDKNKKHWNLLQLALFAKNNERYF